MKIALAAATRSEIEPVQRYLGERLYLKGHHRFSLHLTGVGMVNTALELSRAWTRDKPDIAILAGIAGSFHPLYPPARVVAVKEEIFADLGVRESSGWKDIFDMALADPNEFPFSGGRLSNPHLELLQRSQLETVRAVSVNQVTSGADQAQVIIHKYNPVVESMEGAAFHQLCLAEGIPFIQLRGISNFVGDRNKANWHIQEAIQHLNHSLILLINKIAEQHHA
jgi:futalosine hydrolase